ncbi:cation/H(+) antiporter 20 [Cocos nucifera]|uniref:Cation/H(+) antiporter 20 n=1 Tax=Cocos nucifera TaxID=13894 RepID=A0A8K0IRT7_COCNU|nr:cation/H(+) antiporter 20 [Cocos nucifera]
MATVINMTAVKISSDGAWQGENPLKYALPLLIIQTTLILVLSRALAFLFKPLRQPKVVAEIVGGIVLGPSALGRWKAYMQAIFPSWSSPILDTISSVGLLFFLFLVGLELDLHSICRSGRRAFAIATAGILLPFLSSVGVVLLLRRTTLSSSSNDIDFYPFLVFIGVALSITAFPVLARILAELKLLTTGIGETAMAAAAFNDVVAWVLLALAVALSGSGGRGGHATTPLAALWIILSGSLFVVFMMAVVRPVMAWIARRSNRAVEEVCICLTLAGVLVSGFATDLIGIHSIFGAFVFGLTIPKEGEFAGRLLERIEDFVSGLLLPLYFASSGLKTDVAKIRGAQAWGLLALVITIACVGKIVGTFVVAVSSKIPAREAATLGVLMGTKGLVELIVLNIGKEKKVLNDEMFTIMVLMALFTTFITTPTVMAIYKPTARYNRRFQSESPSFSSSSSGKRNRYLRILACLHSPANVPSIINLIETIRGAEKTRLKLYVMHLVELTERPSSIFTALRVRKNGRPAHHPPLMETCSDLDLGAFQVYEKLGHVKIRRMTAISPLATMHEDVCQVAEDKKVGLVILPFHKRGGEEGRVAIEDMGEVWGGVNQRMLAHAPCSVGLLVDRGFGGPTKTARGICVVFFGGPDDREALQLGTMMMGSPGVNLTVIRFLKCGDIDGQQQSAVRSVAPEEEEEELDEKAVAEIRKSDSYATYEERRAEDVIESVLNIGRSGDYELAVVGRGRCSSKVAAAGLRGWWGEHAELGPVGNILAMQGHGLVSSVLVVQQHSILKKQHSIHHSLPMPPPSTMDGERRSPPGLAVCTTV